MISQVFFVGLALFSGSLAVPISEPAGIYALPPLAPVAVPGPVIATAPASVVPAPHVIVPEPIVHAPAVIETHPTHFAIQETVPALTPQLIHHHTEITQHLAPGPAVILNEPTLNIRYAPPPVPLLPHIRVPAPIYGLPHL